LKNKNVKRQQLVLNLQNWLATYII